MTYAKSIWDTRYFWMNLALADIRRKYRRSLLGLAWAFFQPLMMTVLLSFVIGRFFNSNIEDFAPFLFSGLVFWELIVSCSMSGCSAFISAENYIKQCNHPLMIYTLRSTIPCLINFLYACVGLLIWVLIWRPSNLGLSWLTLFPSFIVLFLFVWPLSTVNAFIGTKFRDYAQFLVILLQALYYISPILFLPKLFFTSHMGFLITYNPIAHLLNLFRKPLLEGISPSFDDYSFSLVIVLLLWLWAIITTKVNEKKIIFYI